MITLLACGFAFLLVAALLNLGRIREWHHGYFGFALAVLPLGVAVNVVGLVVLVDDAYQHWRQGLEPTYLSPAHRLYGVFYRIPWVRRMNAWLDSLLA